MTTPEPAPPASQAGSLTLEQVLQQVSTADPQTFYQDAQRFDDAANRLQDTKNLMSKYRRDLADAWHKQDMQRVNRLDRLIRQVEGVVAGVQNPGYPRLLRQIGDAIADTKQRLNELKDGKANAADDKARADVDKRAAQLLEELSSSYRRLGGELAALPARASTGGTGGADSSPRIDAGSGDAAAEPVALPTARSGDMAGVAGAPMAATAAGKTAMGGGAPVMGGGAFTKGAGTGTFAMQPGGSAKQAGFSERTALQVRPVLEGSATSPETAVPFARFSQYASCPSHAGGPVQGKGKSVAGPGGRKNQFKVANDSAGPSVLGRGRSRADGGTLDAAKQSKENGKLAGKTDRHSAAEFAAPPRVEAQPAAANAEGGKMPAQVSTAGPAARQTASAHAGPAVAAATAGFPGGGHSQGGMGMGGSGSNGMNWGGSNPGGSNSFGSNWGSNPMGSNSGGMNMGGPNSGGANAGGPNFGGANSGLDMSGLNGGGHNSNGTSSSALTSVPNSTPTSAPAAATSATLASVPPPSSAQGSTSAQVSAATQAQIVGAAGTTGLAPSQLPASAPVQPSAPTQVRPIIALGAEHLQLPAAVSPGAPGGVPMAAFAATSNFAQASMSGGSPMHPASSALPAGPYGVLGASQRAEGVWLRADAGSWTSLPVAAPRLGRDDVATSGNSWGTERHNEHGKEGR